MSLINCFVTRLAIAFCRVPLTSEFRLILSLTKVLMKDILVYFLGAQIQRTGAREEIVSLEAHGL
jgi:hypothetical protein